MRRFFAVFLAVLLLISTMIPAYAAAPYDADWVPPVPDFITQIENGFQAGGLLLYGMQEYQEVDDWFDEVLQDENAVVLFLLDQGVYNRYNEENGIDYDRQFSIYMVAPDKKANGSRYDLGVFEHRGGPRHQQQMNTPSPMSYMCLNSPHSFAKFIYDVKTDKLVMQPSLSHLPGGSGSVIRFTYVLAAGNFDSIVSASPFQFVNGAFSEPSDVYPGFTQVCGKDFVGTIYHQVIDGKAVEHWRDYDWWLGINGGEIPPYNQNLDLDQDTDGDGKPDLNVDVDGDGEPDLNIDVDGDGKPDVNIDTDGDQKPDLNIDTNGDGKADVNIDVDGDDKADLNVDTNGDGKPDINIDTNGDRKPDLNIDTNGDRKPDLNIDTNGDKKPDLNIDTDGDQKPDLNIDTTGDGKADTNVDIDGDGKPDVNVKPGGGSGSGSGSSGSGSGSESGSGSGSSGTGSGDGGGGDGGGDNPGGDSGGGSSSDKGSGPPDTWFEDDSDTGIKLNPWEFYDPFQFDYSPFPWDKDYDPLEGYEPGRMPDFPKAGNPNYGAKDPFDVPNDIKFKDFVIQFEKGGSEDEEVFDGDGCYGDSFLFFFCGVCGSGLFCINCCFDS